MVQVKQVTAKTRPHYGTGFLVFLSGLDQVWVYSFEASRVWGRFELWQPQPTDVDIRAYEPIWINKQWSP